MKPHEVTHEVIYKDEFQYATVALSLLIFSLLGAGIFSVVLLFYPLVASYQLFIYFGFFGGTVIGASYVVEEKCAYAEVKKVYHVVDGELME